MRIIFIFFLLFFQTTSSAGQLFEPLKETSKVRFSIRNFGIKTTGEFSGLSGQILFDTASLDKSFVDVHVQAETINTGNKTRDRNLRSSYLESDKFPLIRMTSSRIEKTNRTIDGYYYFTGKVTIKGITKEIAFPFKAERQGQNYRFKGDFRINRLDFGVGSKSLVLADVVTLTIDIMAKHQNP